MAEQLKMITEASYVVKGFLPHNRAAYLKGINVDIWRMVYDRMDAFEQTPTIHKIKSHVAPKEIVVFHRTNKDMAKWVTSNEGRSGS